MIYKAFRKYIILKDTMKSRSKSVFQTLENQDFLQGDEKLQTYETLFIEYLSTINKKFVQKFERNRIQTLDFTARSFVRVLTRKF